MEMLLTKLEGDALLTDKVLGAAALALGDGWCLVLNPSPASISGPGK